MKGVPISKMLQESMKNILDNARPMGLTMDHITRAVAAHYDLTVEEMKAKSNSRATLAASGSDVFVQAVTAQLPGDDREFGGSIIRPLCTRSRR